MDKIPVNQINKWLPLFPTQAEEATAPPQRMKAAAVALDQARRRLTHTAPVEGADDHAPPLPRQTGLLIDGEVPLNAAASGRTPQPGPTTPDGSYDPHRGRGLWGNEHGPVTPTPANEAFDAEVGTPISIGTPPYNGYIPLPSVRDFLDAADDGRNIFIGGTTAARAAWRMFKPFSHAPTWGEISLAQLNRDAARGTITSPEEYIQRLNAIPDETSKRINYTELAEFPQGMRTFSEGALNLTPLALQLYGQSIRDTRPETARDALGQGAH